MINTAIYGLNGHQIQRKLQNHPRARLIAAAGVDPSSLSALQHTHPDLTYYSTLDELLCDPRIHLVSLCSPRRRDQAADAIRALVAGKHVYAEKPCAMSESDLDRIIAAAQSTGRQFHEMAGTACEQPYLAMRQIVGSGMIGQVVQVFAQKSYPYYDQRPQDEDIDGGLIAQVGIHAVRLIEQVSGHRIIAIDATQTALGNPCSGGLNMAANLSMRLDNGALASCIANYLNPRGLGIWGNDHLRVFGTLGLIESVDGGSRTRLVIQDQDKGPLDLSASGLDYFDCFIGSLIDAVPMPLSLDEELHPTRLVLRARDSAIAKIQAAKA